MKKTVTVITPVYNRGKLLVNAYKSLCEQTDKDFEWIIVDDGSKDDSLSVANSFAADLFPITVLSKENGGKHRALNYAAKYVSGEYLLILDSDDMLLSTAIETIKRHLKYFRENKNVGMLAFMRGTIESNGKQKFCYVKNYNTPVDFMKTKRVPIISTDCCEIIKTQTFREYLFPEFENEKFVGESSLWNRISLTQKVVYIDEVVYLCEYLTGGLTASGRRLRINNPQGSMFVSDLEVYPKNGILHRIKYGIMYCSYGFVANLRKKQILENSSYPHFIAFLLPFGKILSIIWAKKYKTR